MVGDFLRFSIYIYFFFGAEAKTTREGGGARPSRRCGTFAMSLACSNLGDALTITAGPVIKLCVCVCVCVYYCSTYYKAVRVGGVGGGGQ